MDWLPFKECSICCEEFKENDTIYKLPCDCEYLYHEECIEDSFTTSKKNTCPLCEKKIVYTDIVKSIFSLKISHDWVTLGGLT